MERMYTNTRKQCYHRNSRETNQAHYLKLRPEISSEMYIQYKLTFLEMQEYAHGDNQRRLLRDALSDKHTSKKELAFW